MNGVGFSTSDASGHRDPQARLRRRRGILLVAGIVVLLLSAGAVLLFRLFGLTGDEDQFRSPDTAALPAIAQERGPTRAYLRENPDGLRVVRFFGATRPLWTGPVSRRMCDDLVTREMPSLGTPVDLYRSASAIPDRGTAELAVGHADAIARFLGRCVEEGERSTDEIRFTGRLLERRLEELR